MFDTDENEKLQLLSEISKTIENGVNGNQMSRENWYKKFLDFKSRNTIPLNLTESKILLSQRSLLLAVQG